MSRTGQPPPGTPGGPVGIAILARAPIPGEAKTRLIPALGAEGAARLQGWMLQRAVATARAAAIGPVALWCAGDPGHADLLRCGVALHRQPAGDLGARMLAAQGPSPGAAGTLVIGTDCPAMTAAHLRQSAAALHTHDAVVIPAEDGGYVLIGMRTPAPEAFAGIDWGSARVMAQTRQRLAALGWRWAEPADLWDVDRAADVERLLVLHPELRGILPLRGATA
jgi:hypothetical protein